MKSPLSDEEYDFLLEQVNDAKFRERVGYELEKNKVQLAVPMGSLNKIKTQKEVFEWSKSKRILSIPKYVSLQSTMVYRYSFILQRENTVVPLPAVMVFLDRM